MRRHADTMMLAVTCSALLCPGSLLAKPTRTLTSPAARRMIFAQPMHRSSRERSSHESGSARIHSGESTAERRRTHIPAARNPALASARTAPRHEPIPRLTAPDRNTRIATERPSVHAHHIHESFESYTNLHPAALSGDFNPQSAVPENAASSDETPIDSFAALSNVGGVLRPAAASLPLNSIDEDAAPPALLPRLRLSSLYDSQGQLIMPRPLYGSHEILLHQNEMADRDGLNRIQNDADLLDLRRQKKLVALPESEALHSDFRLPEDRRYTRPWTAAFLTVMATNFYATFHLPLQVDSAVRTIAVQQRLLRTNGNAAPTSGETASPHLTGQAVDIAKSGLSRTQIAWMRAYLQPFIDVGKIDVEEEFQQSCFHISVYRNFLPAAQQHVSIAAARQPPADTIAERPSY
jgi:hypothetical protein